MARAETKTRIATRGELLAVASIADATHLFTRSFDAPVLALADALDALRTSVQGCECGLRDGTCCGEYDATRIALCEDCARKRDTAIIALTLPSEGAPDA